MRPLLIYILLLVSCQTSSPSKTSSLGADAAAGIFTHEIATIESFKDFSGHPQQLARDVVKYVYDFENPTKPIYFQNVKKFEFHLPFLNNHYPPFDTEHLSLDAYTDAIFGKSQHYPNGKILTAGSLLWSDSWKLNANSTPGTLVFDVYFGSDGAVLDNSLYVQVFPEVKRTFDRLNGAMPFARGKLAFVLPQAFRFGDPTIRNLFAQSMIPVIYANQAYQDEFLKKSEGPDVLVGNILSDLPEILCENFIGGPTPAKRAQTKVGALTFAFDRCVDTSALSTPGSARWLVKRVALVDSSVHVASDRRGKRTIIDVTNPQPNYSIKLGLTHHNGCDSLNIMTPDGSYIFQNGALDPGTLSQDNCGSHAGKLKWDISYSDNFAETGQSDSCKNIYASLCE